MIRFEPRPAGRAPRWMWHGTTTALLPNILRRGLLPRRRPTRWRGHSDVRVSSRPLVHLETQPLIAYHVWARAAARDFGGKPVLLRLRVGNHAINARLMPDPNYGDSDAPSSWVSRNRFPAKHLDVCDWAGRQPKCSSTNSRGRR